MRRNHWERVSPACEQQQYYLVTVAVAVLATGLILLTQLQDPTQPWWYPAAPAAPFAVAGLLALRTYRAGLYTARGRIRVRTVLRTRTFRWAEVAAVSTAPRRRGDPHDPWRSDAIHLDLHDGRRVVSTVRVRNPAEGRKPSGPAYEREDVVRFTAILHDRLLRSRET